jgi:hypothetical protein
LPTISNTSVKVTSSTGKATLSWKVSDCDGIASTTATIDGQTVNVGRKSGNRTTANYAASSILAAGVHTYTITAIDAQGASNTYTGSFTITMSGRRYTVRSGGVPQATAKADWLIDCGAFRGGVVTAAHRQAGVDAVFAAY